MATVCYHRGLLSFIRKNGRRHASPNSGYPEAALAGILHCRFGGTHLYHGQAVEKPYIGTNDRPLCIRDFQRTTRINQRVTFLSVTLITLLGIIINFAT